MHLPPATSAGTQHPPRQRRHSLLLLLFFFLLAQLLRLSPHRVFHVDFALPRSSDVFHVDFAASLTIGAALLSAPAGLAIQSLHLHRFLQRFQSGFLSQPRRNQRIGQPQQPDQCLAFLGAQFIRFYIQKINYFSDLNIINIIL